MNSEEDLILIKSLVDGLRTFNEEFGRVSKNVDGIFQLLQGPPREEAEAEKGFSVPTRYHPTWSRIPHPFVYPGDERCDVCGDPESSPIHEPPDISGLPVGAHVKSISFKRKDNEKADKGESEWDDEIPF